MAQVDAVLAELDQAIRDGKGEIPGTYRQQFNTYLFSHNLASELKHQALLYGLDVTLDSGKGLLTRSHLMTTRGSIRKTWVFWTTALEWMEKNA